MACLPSLSLDASLEVSDHVGFGLALVKFNAMLTAEFFQLSLGHAFQGL